MAEFNFIIANGHHIPGLDEGLFFPGEAVTHVLDAGSTFVDLLVFMQVFPSKGQARREWPNLSKKLGLTTWDIPEGWTDLQGIGKLKHRLTVLKPKPSPEAAEYWANLQAAN